MNEIVSLSEILPLLGVQSTLKLKDTKGRFFGEKRADSTIPLVPTEYSDSRAGGYTNAEAFEAYFKDSESIKEVFGFLSWLHQTLYPKILKSNEKQNQRLPQEIRHLHHFLVFLATVEHIPSFLNLIDIKNGLVVLPAYLAAGVKISNGIFKSVTQLFEESYQLSKYGSAESIELSGESVLAFTQEVRALRGNTHRENVGKKRADVTEVCPAPTTMISGTTDILLGSREQAIPTEIAQELEKLLTPHLEKLIRFTDNSTFFIDGEEKMAQRLVNIDLFILNMIGIEPEHAEEIPDLKEDTVVNLFRKSSNKSAQKTLVEKYALLSEQPDNTINQLLNSVAYYLVAEAPAAIAGFNTFLSKVTEELSFDVELLTLQNISKSFGILSPEKVVQLAFQLDEIAVLPEKEGRTVVEFRKAGVETRRVEMQTSTMLSRAVKGLTQKTGKILGFFRQFSNRNK